MRYKVAEFIQQDSIEPDHDGWDWFDLLLIKQEYSVQSEKNKNHILSKETSTYRE